MKVLIVGNMGYIGPVLVRHLRQCMPEARIVGFDSGYFAHCLTTPTGLPEVMVDSQHFELVKPNYLLQLIIHTQPNDAVFVDGGCLLEFDVLVRIRRAEDPR